MSIDEDLHISESVCNRCFIIFLYISAFVFCALLEFTFVNYMWRKLVPEILKRTTTIPESVNGKGMSADMETDGTAVSVTVVRTVRWIFIWPVIHVSRTKNPAAR